MVPTTTSKNHGEDCSMQYAVIGVHLIVLRSESPSGKWAKLHTVAASSNRDHMPWSLFAYASCYVHMLVSAKITRHDHSVIACSRHIYMGVVLRAHLVRGESHIQRNANGEVATIARCNSKGKTYFAEYSQQSRWFYYSHWIFLWLILKCWLFNPVLIYDCLVVREIGTTSKPKKIQTNRQWTNKILTQIPAQATFKFYIIITSTLSFVYHVDCQIHQRNHLNLFFS